MIRAGLVALVATFVGVAGSVFAIEIPPAEGPGPSTVTPDANGIDAIGNGVNGPGVSAGSVPTPQDVPYAGVISLRVDATDIERHIFNVHESIPVKPGPLTLLYPQWLPGNHAPRGPIDGLAGIVLSSGGRRVDWRRDPLDIYAFHVQVPPGAARLDLEFQYAGPLVPGEGRTIMVTPEILGLEWNTVVLYPAGYYASRIMVAPELTVPRGWEPGTALDIDSRHGNTISFKQVSLEMLVDSPVFTGSFFRRIALDPAVRLDIFADTPASLDTIKPEQIAVHRKLVQEADALFGARHFDHYDLLLVLSDHFGDVGLEHHRSSENRRLPGYFVDWDREAVGRTLLPHEYTHSWNGKFRRPAGLTTPNFNVPMRNELLWVYEGLTSYLEGVLAARSGLWSADFTRQEWAYTAANMDHNRPGRTWRDVEDTTYQPIVTARRALSWLSWERTEDYYAEGALIWLDVDTKIRELSGDRHSLDDFARGFFGGTNGTVGPLTYTFADIVRALNAVVSYDWDQFLTQRLHSHGPGAAIEGLTRGGWKLVYTDTESDYFRGVEDQRRATDFMFSLGLSVSSRDYGQVTEVLWGGPSYEAGLTAGTFLVAVNGREYRPERLREAIVQARESHVPIELIMRNLDRYRIVHIPYYDGLKYPRLERLEKSEDRLSAIVKPRIPLPQPPHGRVWAAPRSE
jgi:predicted metalloprotease with PDZ domain